MKLRCAVILGAVALAACGPPPDVEPLACRNLEAGHVELGVGDLETGFQSVNDGELLPILFGPQGMHMVVLSVRTRNLEMPTAGVGTTRIAVSISQDIRSVSVGMEEADQPVIEVIGGTVAQMPPSRNSGEVADFLGIRGILTADEIAPIISTVEVIVEDGCGRELLDARQLELMK